MKKKFERFSDNSLAVEKVPQQPSEKKIIKKVRYSDTELAEFREIIINKLKPAKEEYEEMKNFKNLGNGTGDTHQEPGDIADKTAQRGGCDMVNEKILQKKYKFITSLEAALLRVDNKSYGICRETGKLIPKERLRVVPHATLLVEVKER